MDIFISWSGQLSNKLARILQEYIPNIIQQTVPFVSSEDLRKGQRWEKEIGEKLKNTNFGIICLTNDNYEEPWILFEAGALSKQLDESTVCPILFDAIDPTDLIENPISQFQYTRFVKSDFHKLFRDINERLGNSKVKEKVLDKAFNAWWPKLQKKVSDILVEDISHTNPLLKHLDNEKPIDRLLRLSDYIYVSVARLGLPREVFDFAKFTNSTELTYLGDTFNHPVRVRIFPFMKDGNHKIFSITKHGEAIVNYERSKYPHRGVTIEILFYQEVESFFSITFSFHKGQTFLQTNQAPELSKTERAELAFNPIWRD